MNAKEKKLSEKVEALAEEVYRVIDRDLEVSDAYFDKVGIYLGSYKAAFIAGRGAVRKEILSWEVSMEEFNLVEDVFEEIIEEYLDHQRKAHAAIFHWVADRRRYG